MCFSPYLRFGRPGGGVSQGIGTQPSTPGSSNVEVFETYFFDSVIT